MIHVNLHVGDGLATAETQARRTFYGIPGIPDVMIDGKFEELGGDTCEGAAARYRACINERMQETGGISPLSIAGSYLEQGDSLAVQVTFAKLDPANLIDLRATILVYEDSVSYQGSYWQHVVRDLHEESIALTDVGDSVTIRQALPVDSAWTKDQLHLIAYLQQTSGDKEMIQGAVVPLGDFRFDLPARVASVPGGSGRAIFVASLTNTSSGTDTFTIEGDHSFGDWTTEFLACGSMTWAPGPIEATIPAGEHCQVLIGIRTDAARQIRPGSIRVTSLASRRTAEYGMRVFNGSRSVLYVDDDSFHNDEVMFLTPLQELGYLVQHWDMAAEGVAPKDPQMAGFDHVIWSTSLYAQSDPITNLNAAHLRRYLDGGGSLFLASQYMLNDPPADPDFLTGYLGVQSYSLDLGYDHLYGVGNDPIGNGLNLPLNLIQTFRKGDHILPAPTASIVFRASGGWNAAIRNETPAGARCVFMASAWEGISQTDPDPNNARVALGRILDWLAPGGQADVIDPPESTATWIWIESPTPNPFGGGGGIRFRIHAPPAAASDPVRLEVLDIEGRRVATLLDGVLDPSVSALVWNGSSDDGRQARAGVYFLRLRTRGGDWTEKVVLLSR